MEDFDHGLRQVVRFRKFEEGGSSMEDQDRETRIDEDVEAHANKSSHKLANDEGDDVEGHSHKLANDEGDDVEGHSHKLANDEGDDVEGHMNKHTKGSHKLANDEGDDVEGHVHLNAVNKGTHKL
jgi:hypothetical protein